MLIVLAILTIERARVQSAPKYTHYKITYYTLHVIDYM